jgi:hypothetical protein
VNRFSSTLKGVTTCEQGDWSANPNPAPTHIPVRPPKDSFLDRIMTKRIIVVNVLFLMALLLLAAQLSVNALVTPSASSRQTTKRLSTTLHAKSPHLNIPQVVASTLVATTVWLGSSSFHPVYAYDTSDYASETVQEVLQSLKTSSGNEDATFKTFENIAGIITEGKGVGGMVNYSK